MKVGFSKSFIKAAARLSGKMKDSLREVILEVEKAASVADTVADITDCKKLAGFNYVYRIRIGNYRAFFIFHVQIVDDTALFQYLLLRGEAYAKKNIDNLRDKDR